MMFELTNIQSTDRRLRGRAEGFLLDNPDPGLKIRPGEEIDRALSTGLGIVLTSAGAICGVSLIYQFDVPPAGPVYSEIGSMRVTANGFGLQVFLAKFHLHQIRLEESEPLLPGVFAVVTPDTASAHNLQEKVHMIEWQPPADLAAIRGAAGVPFSPAKRVLSAAHKTFTEAEADLRRWHERENVFRTPRGSGSINIDVGWFSADRIAAGT